MIELLSFGELNIKCIENFLNVNCLKDNYTFLKGQLMEKLLKELKKNNLKVAIIII